jgi:hypothetical protein
VIAASEELVARDGEIALPFDAAVWFERPQMG